MPIATPQGTLDFKSVDKVTFVGASSNTVIDTTTGSLGIGVGVGGPTSNLHVVGHTLLEGDINMLHTSNTASIKLNSNVVTEFPRSKKLIKYPRVAIANGNIMASGAGVQTPGLSGSQDGFIATSSSNWGGGGADSRAAWCAFDEGTSSTTYKIWQSGDYYTTATPGVYNRSPPQSHTADGVNYEGEWIKLELPHKINVSTIEINSAAYTTLTSHHNARPYEGAILGSNDDTNWSLLKSFSGGLSWTPTTVAEGGSRATLTPDANATNYYKYLMLVVNKNQGSRTTVDINEIRYYGVPEYDPEAHGTDVVVKSVPNVPNTDWLEVYYDAKDLVDGAVTSVDDLTPSGTNDGTATNVTVSDGAFVFNGTSSLLESSTTITNSTGDTPHTFSLWVKPSEGDLDDTNNHYLIVYGTELDTGKWSGISISNKRFASVIHASVVRFGPEVRVGEWYHITLNYKGGGIHNSDRFDFFINGLQIDTTALSTAGSQAGSATLNLSSPAKVVLGGLFTGAERSSSTIANFRLFNRALTSDEIWQLYAYQKEYFGHGDLGMTLKAGRLGIGTSEPRAALDVRGNMHANGGQSWPIPCAIFSNVTPSNTGSTYYENNIGTTEVNYNKISLEDPSGTIQASVGSPNITLNRVGMYEFHTESALKLQSGAGSSHIGHAIISAGVSGSGVLFEANGYELITTTYNTVKLVNRTSKILVTSAPYVVKYQLQPIANYTDRFIELAYGNNNEIHMVAVKYLG